MALFGPTLIMEDGSVDETVSDVIGPVEVSNVNELTFFAVFSSGVNAGAVQFEEAHDPNYEGAWAPIGSAVSAADNCVKTVKATGVSMCVRGRISTAIGGGTVNMYVMGR